MKKLFVILSIVLFALLAAVELYVQSDAFALRIRPVVIDRLQAVLGTDARIGWVRANFIPMYLEARDISLPAPDGGEAASVRKIKIYINPLPLLLKKIRLPSIVLLEPRIYAERTKDGQMNLSPLIDRIRTNIARLQRSGGTGFSVLLRTVTVNEGTISFKDDLSSTQCSLSSIQFTTMINPEEESLKAVLTRSAIGFSSPAYPRFSGDFDAIVRYDHGKIRVESAELTTADTALSLSGTAGLLPGSPLDLRMKIRSGPQTLGRFSGFLRSAQKERGAHVEAAALIRGSLADPSAEGTLKLSGVAVRGFRLDDASLAFGYKNKNLTLTGRGWKLSRGGKTTSVDSIDAALGYSDRGLDIRRCDVVAGDLSLAAAGRIDTQRGFDAALTAESHGRGRTLSFFVSQPVEGSVDVQGRLTGAFEAPLFDGEFSASPLTVRGVLFDRAGGRLRYGDRKFSLLSADIHRMASRYLLDASVDLSGKAPVFSARLRVIRSDVVSVVALFYQAIPIQLTATGELSFQGTAGDFTGSGRLSLDAGSAYGETFTRGTIVAELTKGKITFPSVSLNKGGGTVKGSGWIGFDGAYSADLESSGVRLSEVDHLADLPFDGRVDLAVHSSGTFSRPLASASLSMDELAYHGTVLGGLSAELRVSDGLLMMNSALAGKSGEVSARLGLSRPYPWSLQAKLRTESLDPLLALGRKDLAGRVRLVADGTLNLRGNGVDQASLSGSAAFRRLSLLAGDYRIDNAAEALVTVQGGRLGISSLGFTGAGTKISVSGALRPGKDLDLSISGTAHLSLLRLLFREIEHADGRAEMNLAVRDGWEHPAVSGELFVKNGEIKIKDIPQKFSALNGKLAFDQSRIVVDSLTGEAGGGTLAASGWAQLSGFAIRDFSTSATFENVTVRYPTGLTSTLSGGLSYDGNASEQSLTGDVLIRRARYDKRVEWKSMLVDIGKGLYQRKKTEVGWIGDTQINVRFHGKDNILLQNNLAKIPLAVDVFMRGTVNQPQLLGRIEATKGSVYFRKNEFTILHASADFVDPNRMNPVLDIQAEIEVRDYRIRLAVAGTADRAVVTLLSDPPLPDSDILTLLALGKTGSELKGREAGVGMSEAASFATGQFQDMFESRARSLTGLDRFQVDPYLSSKSDTSVPRVTVGKELLQDKLYVTYSSNVGAATAEQVFRIEYILDRHFSLVGERNELGDTGADIKYRFEFK